MGRPLKGGVARENATERQMRDQEVLRANKELAAYFKGRRTEREARAALRIIKAFVRDRERADPRSRPPLPGAESTTPAGRTKMRQIETTRKSAGSRHARGQVPANSAESHPGRAGEPSTTDGLSRDESS
jgi:hypothetical protein